MPYLALKNLRLRKLRTAISVLAVAVGIMTLVVLRGLTEGTIGEVANRMQSVNADLLVWDKSRSTIMHRQTMSGAYREKIAPLPGVSRVVPVLNDAIKLAGQAQTVYAVPAEDFETFGGTKALLPGGRLFNPGAMEMVIDTLLAKSAGLGVGSIIENNDQKFTVVGIIREGVVGRVFMPYDTAAQLWYNGEKRANMLMVKVAAPGDVGPVTAAIQKLGLIVVDKGNYYSVIAKDLKGLDAFILGTTVMTLTVSFLTILLTMFTIIQEQTREVGILKSLGASQGYIMRTVLAQSLIICGAGVALGLLLSLAARAIFGLINPLLTVSLDWHLLVTALLVGVVGGLLGAVYPAWRASRLDPVQTLNYE